MVKKKKEYNLDDALASRAAVRRSLSRTAELRKADNAFSLFIRTRDAQEYEGRYFKCISCGMVKPIEKADCGHYINRQHMSLRFNELNCNAQCSHCNRFDEGNASGYRNGLIEKIGEPKVILLESMKHNTNHMSAFELKAVADYYKKKVKEFKYQIR